MQLELFPFDDLSESEKRYIIARIRNSYWHIRSLRKADYAQASLRKHYRRVQAEKKRLLLAGVGKASILDLLRCCRLQCDAYKQPFKPCKYCP